MSILRPFILLFLPFILSAQPVQLYFQPDTVYVEPGETITIHLRVNQFTDISNADFSITWDTSAIQVIGVSRGSNDLSFNPRPNQLIAAFVSLSGQGQTLKDSSVLLTFTIKARTQHPVITKIEFSALPLFYRYNAGFEPAAVLVEAGVIYIRQCTTTLDLGSTYRFCPGDSVKIIPDCQNCQSIIWGNGTVASYWYQKTPGWVFSRARGPLQCFFSDSVRVETLPFPTFTLPPTANICPNETAILAPQPAQSTYAYQWSTGQTTRNITISEPGTYTLTVTNPENCSGMDTIRVTKNGPVDMTITTIQPDCKKPTGTLVLGQVQGGTGDYLFSIDGGQNFSANATFNNLPPRLYQPIVQDIHGCEHTGSIRLNRAFEPFIKIQIPTKTILNTGDSLLLRAEIPVNYPQNLVKSVIWHPKEAFNPIDSLEIWIKPERHTTYIATVTSRDGCTASDSIAIQVRQIGDLKVFIPTVFAPEGAGNNRIFNIAVKDIRIEQIRQIAVYDRWGNLVFEANNASGGWDGTFQGRPAASGVYGFAVKLEMKDRTVQILRGDVTLIR